MSQKVARRLRRLARMPIPRRRHLEFRDLLAAWRALPRRERTIRNTLRSAHDRVVRRQHVQAYLASQERRPPTPRRAAQ